MTAVAAPAQTPYRPFRVRVLRRERLSPSFVRVTFSGLDLDLFGDDGPDQRIKVWIPAPGRRLPDISPDDWYATYRTLPDDHRGAVRTYTIRAVRPERAEVDVDFVLHGVTGPASAWATTAQVGDELVLIGPNRAYGADCAGHEWKPPSDARTVIIAGDETATPAVVRILETLAEDPRPSGGTRVHAFLEVPYAADVLEVPTAPHVDVTWLPRDDAGTEPGELLVTSVCAAATRAVEAGGVGAVDDVADIDVDTELLWEVAEPDAPGAHLYAWIAGEAAAVKQIRRHLVNDLGVDRRQVTFMGYWRRGRAEA